MSYSIDYKTMNDKELKDRWNALDKLFWRNMASQNKISLRNENLQNRINYIRDELDHRNNIND